MYITQVLCVFLVAVGSIKTASICPGQCKCSSYDTVVCRPGNLTMFPRGIPTSTKYLYISYNNLQKISADEVRGLKKLKSLHLNGNLLTTLEKEVMCKMPNLMDLVLSSNKITMLAPNTFSCLTQLEELNLKNNLLEYLYPQTFSGLYSLKALNIAFNKLERLAPEVLSPLLNLTYLDVFSNRIKTFDANTFSSLSSLRRLDVSCNRISSIHSKAFQGLFFLRELTLHDNKLEFIGEFLQSLRYLIKLDLSNNQIRFIYPKKFSSNHYLRQLNLGGNKLVSLHRQNFVGLVSLQKLDLFSNSITSIAEGAFNPLKSMRILIAGENKLQFLDQCMLSGSVTLKELYLNNNSLNRIEDHTFEEIVNLQILEISNNNLTQVKMNTFSGLEKISRLYLSKNAITYIHRESFRSLRGSKVSVFLYSNKLQCSCQHLRWLKSLNFHALKADCINNKTQPSALKINTNTREWSAWTMSKDCESDDCSKMPSMRTRPCVFCSQTKNLICVETMSDQCISFDFKKTQMTASMCEISSACEKTINCSQSQSSQTQKAKEDYMKEKVRCRIATEGGSLLRTVLSVLLSLILFILMTVLCGCFFRKRTQNHLPTQSNERVKDPPANHRLENLSHENHQQMNHLYNDSSNYSAVNISDITAEDQHIQSANDKSQQLKHLPDNTVEDQVDISNNLSPTA